MNTPISLLDAIEHFAMTAPMGGYLKVSVIGQDNQETPFTPPPQDNYDQIFSVRLGISGDAFRKIRQGKFNSWKSQR